MKLPGLFITLEGLDGCGKSTQIRLLSEHLQRQGITTVLTKEPGGTPVGQALGELVASSAPGELAPATELAMMFAARAQHIERVVLPALHNGRIVLSDRFTDSTVAYQGYGHGVPLEVIRVLGSALCQNVQPDLTLLLDITARTSATRAAGRNQSMQQSSSRFEREDSVFFERVRKGYLALACEEPERIKVIDGEAPLAEVHRRVVEEVSALLARLENAGGI